MEEVLDIYSPLSGKVIPVSEVSDPVFAQKLLGDGVGIIPNENKVYAPCDAEIATLFPAILFPSSSKVLPLNINLIDPSPFTLNIFQ